MSGRLIEFEKHWLEITELFCYFAISFLSELDLTRIIFDLFFAGFDTVSNTLRWFILFMAKYPDVQRRVQQQIDDVVPRDTLPSYEHKTKCVSL